ncbi:MAG: cytochrome c biogenesis protein CcdA [Thermoleophilaceae bacterium]|nr:cytochrome c biogenesis protein CcdA [Thermoleophilaceae bacterium]
MADSPTISLAFAAGLVSFVSPCCLPLVPGYLAAVSGKAPGEQTRRLDPSVLARSLLFIASFSAVFILLGLTATAIGAFLFESQLTLRKVAGVGIVLMGLLFIAAVFVTRLNRDFRPGGLIERAGSGGPVVAGVAFAFAWTPCIGPTLAAILGLASTQQSTVEAAGLLAVYSAGLGIPFLLSAVGWGAAQRSFEWVRRHYAAIQVGAGLVLVVMGVLVYTNDLFLLNVEIQRTLDDLGLNFFQSV